MYQRNKPLFSYSGLTVVLSHASRFDKHELLSATAGWFFNERVLRPELNKFQCDIRVKEDKSPLLDGTKCVLLLGESAAKEWLQSDNTLGEIRGSIFNRNNIPHICSFFPQDCVDIKNYEQDLNPLAQRDSEIYGESDDDEDDDFDVKRRHGVTKRRNFGWWLIQDCKKVKHILEYGLPDIQEPEYIVYPKSEAICDVLLSNKNKDLFLDIETDYDLNITCFSFAFDDRTIYCVPCLLPDYSWAYTSLPQIFKYLAISIRDNCLVCHNGANFDYFVLAHKYRIPIGERVYDTLISHHRCFPEIEKSLGHVTSHLTWESFHKDMGDVPYNNLQNARQTWEYCGKDVYTMCLIKKSLDKYAKTIPGLEASIAQAMSSIKPYLTTTLQGIAYRQDILAETVATNDRLMTQYLRLVNYLIGPKTVEAIRGKSKKGMCGSNVQCVRYFHDLLNYPVVARGKETKSGATNPSLGKKALYKLALNHKNPVITLTLLYRELARESGSLSFTPWKQ